MAKALKFTNVRSVPGGLVFELERLGDRFEMPLRFEGVPFMLMAIGREMAAAGLAVQRELDTMAFAPEETGAILALQLKDWPLMAVQLDWRQLQGLADLASSALEHAPTSGRSN